MQSTKPIFSKTRISLSFKSAFGFGECSYSYFYTGSLEKNLMPFSNGQFVLKRTYSKILFQLKNENFGKDETISPWLGSKNTSTFFP